MISLYDTARQEVVPLQLRDPGKVSIYVCGPTVYAPPHLGHGRQTLVYDVLRRYLEWAGYEVTFVSNVTDIDDNII
jgi:cysteinyl-tRNA synthetase